MFSAISCVKVFNGGFRAPGRIHIDGRPRFAKLSIDDVKKVEIAAIDPDFGRGYSPWSLMEYADRYLYTISHSRCRVNCRLNRPRSDLSCHHVLIACAIGGFSS